MAVQRRVKNKDGKYDADFLTVVAWRQTADFCNKYLAKGRKVAVEGSIQTRSYDAQDGTKRFVTEIIADQVELLESRQSDAQPARQPVQQAPQPQQAGMDDFAEVDDDELPFN